MRSPKADVSALPDLRGFDGLLSDRVYESLRAAILALDFEPGAVLRKADICTRFGVSRSPVSDAIIRLEADGLVEVVPQSATRVSKMSMREIREDAFLREALEVSAVEYAAIHHTEELLARLARNLRAQESQVEDGDFEEFFRTDQAFHSLIIDCCNIARLPEAIRFVSHHVDRARLMLLPEPGRSQDSVAEHVAIYDAIRAGDPDQARAAMQAHLRQLIERLAPLEKERPHFFATEAS